MILAGAVLILAGVRAESVTEGSRQRLVGMGHLFFYFGTATWAIAVIISVIRLINSQY